MFISLSCALEPRRNPTAPERCPAGFFILFHKHRIPEGLRLERTSGRCPVQPPAPARPPPAGVPGLFQLEFRHLQGWQTPPLSPQGMSSLHAQHSNGARGGWPTFVPELVALVCLGGSAGAAVGTGAAVGAATRAHFSLFQPCCALSTSPTVIFGHLLAFPTFPLFSYVL